MFRIIRILALSFALTSLLTAVAPAQTTDTTQTTTTTNGNTTTQTTTTTNQSPFTTFQFTQLGPTMVNTLPGSQIPLQGNFNQGQLPANSVFTGGANGALDASTQMGPAVPQPGVNPAATVAGQQALAAQQQAFLTELNRVYSGLGGNANLPLRPAVAASLQGAGAIPPQSFNVTPQLNAMPFYGSAGAPNRITNPGANILQNQGSNPTGMPYYGYAGAPNRNQTNANTNPGVGFFPNTTFGNTGVGVFQGFPGANQGFMQPGTTTGQTGTQGTGTGIRR